MLLNCDFWKNKRVLLTGHTGFKGTWMCQVLHQLGAQITGYALKPPTSPSIFELSGTESLIDSVEGDVRDLAHLQEVFAKVQPEIVIHMAAQPIVRESYANPVYTYDVNVMGTVNVLECVRTTDSVKSFLNVTTDKVYLNREWPWGYRENEELNGYDPYSNSKSCSELVTASYRSSFFTDGHCRISTARAGNVIGAGDFAKDRIIPDCIRAMEEGKDIVVRNPHSTRPYQHVLEPVLAYLMIAERQWEDGRFAGSYNIGPDDCDCLTTGELVTLFCQTWQRMNGQKAEWINQYDGGPHEANFLKLDCSKAKQIFGWQPVWHIETVMEKIVEFSRIYIEGGDTAACMRAQIAQYLDRQDR